MNNGSPAISVIIPIYNAEKYINKCLQSLVKQTFSGYELILINDGSTDNSHKIINKYVRKYPDKIFAYSKPNGGVSSARNMGIELSRGKYICFIDIDDYVKPDYLKRMYNAAIRANSDLTFVDIMEVDVNEKPIKLDTPRPVLIGSSSRYFNTIVWAQLFKRELVVDNNIRFPEGKLYEDTLFGFMAQMMSKKIVNLNYFGYYYRIQNSSSVSYTYKNIGIPDDKFPYNEFDNAIETVKRSIPKEKNFYYEIYVLFILSYSLFYFTRKLDLSFIENRCNFCRDMVLKHLPGYSLADSVKILRTGFKPLYNKIIIFIFALFHKSRLLKYLVFLSNILVRFLLAIIRISKK